MLSSLFTFTLNSGAFQHIGGRHASGTLGNNLVSIVRVWSSSGAQWTGLLSPCCVVILKCLRAKLFLYPGLPSLTCVVCCVLTAEWPSCAVPGPGNTGTEYSCSFWDKKAVLPSLSCRGCEEETCPVCSWENCAYCQPWRKSQLKIFKCGKFAGVT